MTPTHYRQCGALGRPILIALGVPADLLDGKCDDMIMALHSTRNFWELSAFKYLYRAGEKDAAPADLTKALDCLTRLSPRIGGTVPSDEVLGMIRSLIEALPDDQSAAVGGGASGNSNAPTLTNFRVTGPQYTISVPSPQPPLDVEYLWKSGGDHARA